MCYYCMSIDSWSANVSFGEEEGREKAPTIPMTFVPIRARSPSPNGVMTSDNPEALGYQGQKTTKGSRDCWGLYLPAPDRETGSVNSLSEQRELPGSR